MSNVSGYYNTPVPSAPAKPVAAYSATPAATPTAGTPVSYTETWTPTSSVDPYVSGMRTTAAAMAAANNVKHASTIAKWGNMLRGRSAAGLSNAGKAIQSAKSVAQKAAHMDKAVLLKNQTKVGSTGPFSALRGTFMSFGNVARAIGSSAIIAVPMSIVTNFMDWKAGKVNEQQRNTLIVADSIGYTATGASATLIGGAVGSTFLGPGVGTVVGIAAGFGLGWVYEK
ncbi:MAG: hypothetical protein ACK46X_16890, partial [Candidatus Sericytochromatia bacterium]